MINEQQNSVLIKGQTFQLTQLLSKDDQGSVYKGQSTQNKEYVKVKIKKCHSEQEQLILESLCKQPKQYFIGVKAIQKQLDKGYLAILELEDFDLYNYMQSEEYKKLEKAQRNKIFEQMVLAVKDLHDLRYFHRDLKPENFGIFKQFGNTLVKLMDFDLCKQQQSNNQTKNVGTPLYMAPEILNTECNYTNKVDAWSLGCIWFEILTDQTFFQGNTSEQLQNQIKNCTQTQINQRIQNQQVFDSNEKFLIEKLLQINIQLRLDVKDLVYYIQNPNQIRGQFKIQFNPQQPMQGTYFPQFSQVQNNLNFNPNLIANRQNSPIKGQQPNQNWQQFKCNFNQIQQQNLNQQEQEKYLKQQHLEKEMREIIEIQKVKREEEEKQEKLKKKNDEIQLMYQDKITIEQHQIRNKIEIKYQEEVLKRKQEEQEKIEQKIAQEMNQKYLQKQNEELQEKKKKEELEKQQQFNEMKNKASKTIRNIKDVTEKFIQNLEEKSLESKQICFQNNNLQNEFNGQIQNYLEQFRKKLIIIRQDEHSLQQINQYLEINVVQEFEEKYFQEITQIMTEQSNVQNEIAKKLTQLLQEQQQISKIKKEQIEQQQNQLRQQLQETKAQYESTYIETEKKIKEFNININNIEHQLSLLSEERYQQHFKNIVNQCKQITQSIFLIKQTSSQQSQYQEISVQIYSISQLTDHLIRYRDEVGLLIKQKEELIKELEIFNNEEKIKAKIQLEQFEDEALKYDQALKRHQNQQQQNHQLIQKMQQLNNQYHSEVENFKTILNANTIIQRPEILKLKNLLNQYLKDLENYDIQLINYFEEQTKITRQQELLNQLFEQANQVRINSEKSQGIHLQQLKEHQNISEESKNQIELFRRMCEEIIEEYLKDIQKLKQQNFEITLQNLEQQALKYNSLIAKFIENFDEKNRIAQNMILEFNEIQKVQNSKLVYITKFTLEIGQIKEVIRDLKFSQGFEIYGQIIQHKQKNEEKIEQLKQYFEKCFNYFNENQELYHKLKKNIQAKKEFSSQRSELSRQLDKLYHQSKEKIKQLEDFQVFISRQCQKIKFEGSVQDYQEVNQQFRRIQEIQTLLEQFNQQAFDFLHQFSQTDISRTQDFIQKIDKDLLYLEKIKLELQAIKLDQIQKLNTCLQQNFESFVLQIFVITTFSIYMTNEYYARKIRSSLSADEKKKSQLQLEKDQEEQAIVKAQLKKFRDEIEGRKFLKCNVQELLQECNLSEEKQFRLLIDITNKNRVKLRAFIKDQQVIKEVINFVEYQEFCTFIILNKLSFQ